MPKRLLQILLLATIALFACRTASGAETTSPPRIEQEMRCRDRGPIQLPLAHSDEQVLSVVVCPTGRIGPIPRGEDREDLLVKD